MNLVQEKTFLGAISKAWTTASQVTTHLSCEVQTWWKKKVLKPSWGKYVLPLQKSHKQFIQSREIFFFFFRNLFSTLANILNRARFFTVQALLGVASEAWTLPGDDRDPILFLRIASWFWYKKPSCQLKPSRICQLKDWKHPIFCPTVSLGLHSHATMQESFIMILNPRPNSHTSPQHHHKSKLTVRLRSTAALDILISIFRATLIVYSQSVFLPDEPFRITPFFFTAAMELWDLWVHLGFEFVQCNTLLTLC